MGLAERFKDKLNNKDIFKEKEIENILEKKEIKFNPDPDYIETSRNYRNRTGKSIRNSYRTG